MRACQLRWAGLCLPMAALLALACSSDTSSGPQPPPGSGQLVVNLSVVNAPNPQVDQLWVNVTQVTAHSTTAGWKVVQKFATPLPLDLLQLKTASVQLGLANLSLGSITQIRLYVAQSGNYVVRNGQTEDLKVPSGYQSGIKINGPWEITECNRTTVTLDFDGDKSIAYHQNGTGQWILRPVIRVKKAETAEVGCDGDDGGQACSEANPCPEGELCQADVCVPGGGDGTPCSVDSDCLSGTCNGSGTCGKSPPDGFCQENDDCINNTCLEGGSCAPCTNDTECAAVTCGGGACVCSQGACVDPVSVDR